MHKNITFSGALTAGISAVLLASASAQQTPILGTGWTQDMVVGIGEATGQTQTAVTATMDSGTGGALGGGGYTWYQVGQNTNAPTTGLPSGTTFVSAANAGTSYFLQPATQDNAILVNGGNGGTFTLATPGAYSTLSFAASTGSGNQTVNYTINFAGGATETGTFASPDWFANTPVAIGAGGRIDPSDGAYDSVSNPGGNPNLYQEDVTVANTAGTIDSIAFSAGAGGGNTAIMAISGTVSAVPEPSTWVAAGGLLLLAAGDFRRRLKA